MKHFILPVWTLVFILLIILVIPASGEQSTPDSEVETATFKRFTVPVDVEDIDLAWVKVEREDYPAFYEFLHQLPNLKHVDMFSTQITAPYIEELTTQFPQVTFGWTIQIGTHLVRTDAVVFSTLHYDHDKRHTEEDFALLRYCPDLMALDIGHNELHDLSFLYDLPKLRVLILSDDRIDCDLTPIGSLKDLLFLEMYSNKITDITPLSSLTNLHHLNINFNLIEDLTPLKSLTNLENLWVGAFVNNTKPRVPLDQETIDDLTAALPNTRINTTARTNDGEGWLDFVDEKRVKRMFNGKVYLPLECEKAASAD